MIKCISAHSQTNVKRYRLLLCGRRGRWADVTLVVLQDTGLVDDLNFARFVRLGFFVYVDSLLVLCLDGLLFPERWFRTADCRRLFVIRIYVSRWINIWSVEFVHRLRLAHRGRSLVDHGRLRLHPIIVVHLVELVEIAVHIILWVVVVHRLLAGVRILIGGGRLTVIVLITVLVRCIVLVVAASVVAVVWLLLLLQGWLRYVNLSSLLVEVLLSTLLFFVLLG